MVWITQKGFLDKNARMHVFVPLHVCHSFSKNKLTCNPGASASPSSLQDASTHRSQKESTRCERCSGTCFHWTVAAVRRRHCQGSSPGIQEGFHCSRSCTSSTHCVLHRMVALWQTSHLVVSPVVVLWKMHWRALLKSNPQLQQADSYSAY